MQAVYIEIVTLGTACAEPTVFRPMQRMEDLPVRPPCQHLERVGRQGLRLVVKVSV